MNARRAVSYQLVIEVMRPRRIAIGRLGTFEFAAGTYVYTGSARRNFEARIARHQRKASRCAGTSTTCWRCEA